MNKRITIAMAALAGTSALCSPALAQTSSQDAIRDELAAMRAQMQAMAQRIQTLEAELDTTRAAAAAATTSAAEASEVAVAASEAAKATKVEWKGAPKLSTSDGWSFKPRGRVHYVVGTFNAPDSTGREDGYGSELRRARLGVEGDIPGGFGYKFEFDVAGGEVEVTDALVNYEAGNVELTVGQHNNFQSLEELTSSRFVSMVERAAFTDAFGFERRLGVSAQYSSGDLLVQAGLFNDNTSSLSSKNWSVDGRLVFMPEMGDAQLHLGGSIHFTDLNSDDTVRYRQRPLVHFTSERFVNTGNLDATSERGLGLEAAVIAGPFHAASEGFWQKVNRPGALSDPTFFGGYAEVGMFLTPGDSRGYKGGTFDRVKPENPVGEGGIGAIQVNLRYDHLDLNDAGVIGGKQKGYLASMIWTPIDYLRFQFNYGRLNYSDAVYAKSDGDTSYGVDAFGLAGIVDF